MPVFIKKRQDFKLQALKVSCGSLREKSAAICESAFFLLTGAKNSLLFYSNHALG